jgi:lipopolysaccharide/colanic/teichoic acid biosynthesis glycosyltransferase
MVKFGYANTIQQMLKRAEFDYLYLENRSLTIDFKIIIYTIRTILTGKGI